MAIKAETKSSNGMWSAALKYESMCIDPTEKWLYAGNACGEVHSIDIEAFTIKNRVQSNTGIVQAITAHKSLPYVATLSTDRTVSVLRRDDGRLSPLISIPLRDIQPSNDTEIIPPVQSTSQALGFHPRKPRLVTRSGNAGVTEVEFDAQGGYRVLWCVRLHADADLISARYVNNSDQILSGAIDGQFVLSEGGHEIRRWQIGEGANVHWAEHLSKTIYLLASDIRYVARIDISGRTKPFIGPQFTKDDLEHVTYNKKSKRAFVATFDRKIYEIEPRTCKPIRTAFEAPFKCRWIKTLERDPRILLVQCRNGGLYKANLDTGECLAAIRETPDALWTSVRLKNGTLMFSGEGKYLTMLEPRGVEKLSRSTRYNVRRVMLNIDADTYTKRMVIGRAGKNLLLGRTNGDLVEITLTRGGKPMKPRVIRNLGSAVRDVTLEPDASIVYAACEDGSVRRIRLDTGRDLATWQSPVGQPIWSLAHNPTRAILAVAERNGSLFFLDDESLEAVGIGPAMGRPKRMKFESQDSLIYNHRDELYRLDLRNLFATRVVGPLGNTIEDFIWDEERRYLVMIGYTQNLTLCDYHTGEILSSVPDQIDYSKGLAWATSEGSYPLDFVTFGRSGAPHLFRIHDEKILAIGPLSL
jgi:WD40 repeat protein